MQKIKDLLKNEKYYSVIIILIASIFVCVPLMSKNIDMTYDDGIQHICRLMGTYQSLQEGQTKIMSNFCNGFGYSWNIFYSPLTAFLPLIFKLIGASFAGCIKLFMFANVFLSGYFMYICAKKITKNTNIAILSAIFYVLAPYRLTDMYIRNAIAELTSFTFLPLVFLGLYNIFEDSENEPGSIDIEHERLLAHNLSLTRYSLEELRKKSPMQKKQFFIFRNKELILSIGAIGLILTHTVITMYTAIFAFIYVLINIKKLKDKRIIKLLIINILLILVITAFFWVPLLEHKITANYEVFKPGRMERTEVLVAYKLDFYRLFFTKSTDYMIYEIGIITIISLLLTPLAVKKIKEKEYYKIYLFMLISGIASVIMTLKIFPFEYMPSILKMIQFTFRLLEFSSFFFSIISAINIVTLSKKIEIKEIIILLVAITVLTIPLKSHLRTLENYDESKLWPAVEVNENTGRVHAGLASFEYLPTKAFENRSYIETRGQNVIALNENSSCQIENEVKNGVKMSFDVKYVLEETRNRTAIYILFRL